jgi:hypothetical protein
MCSYHVKLRETRMTTEGIDDVALFDVIREKDGESWQVPVFLSPLFRLMQMNLGAAVEDRRDMVAGLGARAISERLLRGQEPSSEDMLVFAIDYPGAPSDPNPLATYEHIVVSDGEVKIVPVAEEAGNEE